MSAIALRSVGRGAKKSLTHEAFDDLAQLMEQRCGIQLREGKEMLVRSRLGPRMSQLGLSDVGEYLALARRDGAELSRLVDLLTTNKTGFFRESRHFDFLKREVLPALDRARPFRIWSAGCSTGEEPYSLAMLWREVSPHAPAPAILATDISTRALAQARAAEYGKQQLTELDPAQIGLHFTGTSQDRYTVRKDIRASVSFARLNLVDPWPMRGPFDLILCRNVMIYFSRKTQRTLAQRYASLLSDGGHLFVGHAESLECGDMPLEFVQPAVYRKTRDRVGAPERKTQGGSR